MKLLLASATMVLLSVTGSYAGGLFGDGGLIRGSVGEIFDPIERNVLTPLAQGSVNAGAAAAGGWLGGSAGAAIGGGIVGPAINDAFAGGRSNGGPQPPAMHPVIQQPMPMQMMGNRCLTQGGLSGFGPLNPIGSFCTMGPYTGVVVQ
ncbi:MAG: hypothetical protein INF93_07490 [Rhodobacter sp.]|nr:hypothetical protein [Rhodobacter sp.]